MTKSYFKTKHPKSTVYSQVTTADPGSNKIEGEELVLGYCNNGCQGASASLMIDLNRNITLSEPTLSAPSYFSPLPLLNDPLAYHFGDVVRPDSESNLRQRRLIQHLKERFAKNFGTDFDGGSHGSRRILGFPVFSRKTSGCDKDANEKEKGSNKSASHKEINIRDAVKKAIKGGLLKKGGANKKGENSSRASKAESNETQVGKNENGSSDLSNAEVSKGGSHAKVNERERKSVPDIGDDLNTQKKRDSLRLLKGLTSFKKNPGPDGENQSHHDINEVVEQ